MKKLFLQDGKLMVGEFPEEPTSWGQEDSQYYGCVRDEYHKAVEAAKASAVEVVNPEIFPYNLDGQNLNNIPKGWTVEIYREGETGPGDDQYEVTKARLIPLKEQSSGIAAVGVAEYGPLAEEYIGTWMIKENDIPQVHRQLDKILGVPEYGKGWEGEKLDLLQHHETIATDSAGIPESGEKDYEQYYKTPPNDRDWAWYLKGLKEGYGQAEFEGHKRPVPWPPKKEESVSPPPQAESRWISVDDEWPLETMPVLWCHDPVEEPYIVASLLDEGFDENQYTHWMPLPEPPITRKAKP